VLNVQLDGHRKLAAPSVNLVRLELSATSEVRRVKVVASDSTARVKKKMLRVYLWQKVPIQQNVLTVRQDGHPRRGALNAKPAELEHMATAVNHAH
jgi:hypothetical protein